MKTRISILTLSFVLAGSSLCSAGGSRPRFQVTDLGTLPGAFLVYPRAINNHGEIVGRASNSNGVSKPFVYRGGRMTEIDIGDGLWSTGEAFDINDRGQIIAQATVTNFFRGYLITPEATLDLNEQTGIDIWPERIDEAGEIVGFTPQRFTTAAISWRDGVVRRLGELEPGAGSLATDINNLGVAVGQAFITTGPPAGPSVFGVLFQDGAIVNLGLYYPRALNDYGEMTGAFTSETGYGHAFLFRGGSLIDIGTLPGDRRSWGNNINKWGDVIGYSEDSQENIRAFLYSDGVLYDLNDLVGRNSGWRFLAATGNNDEGRIVGVGMFRGQERAYLLTPVGKKKREPRS
jgi:probable HAF family extracellular repeat protein